MGWYFELGASKEDIVRDLLTSRSEWTIPKHALRKDGEYWVLWTVHQHLGTPTQCFIGCYLLDEDTIGWGYKPMDADMGPNFYTCPKHMIRDALAWGWTPSKYGQEWIATIDHTIGWVGAGKA